MSLTKLKWNYLEFHRRGQSRSSVDQKIRANFPFRPNLFDSHRSLLLLLLIDAGFIEVSVVRRQVHLISWSSFLIDVQALTELIFDNRPTLCQLSTSLLFQFIDLVDLVSHETHDSTPRRSQLSLFVSTRFSVTSICPRNKVFSCCRCWWTRRSPTRTSFDAGFCLVRLRIVGHCLRSVAPEDLSWRSTDILSREKGRREETLSACHCWSNSHSVWMNTFLRLDLFVRWFDVDRRRDNRETRSVDSIRSSSKRIIFEPNKLFQLASEKIDREIKNTNTLQTDDYRRWNWDSIYSLLKVRSRRNSLDSIFCTRIFSLKNFARSVDSVEGDLYERFVRFDNHWTSIARFQISRQIVRFLQAGRDEHIRLDQFGRRPVRCHRTMSVRLFRPVGQFKSTKLEFDRGKSA